jgi:hypothetical protein
VILYFTFKIPQIFSVLTNLNSWKVSSCVQMHKSCLSLSPSRGGTNHPAIAPVIMNNAGTLSLVHSTALVLRRCVQHSKNETPSSHHMTFRVPTSQGFTTGRLRLKCDGRRAETRFCLSAKRTSPFKSAGASFQSTTGSRGVRFSGSNAGYVISRGRVEEYWLPTPFASFPFASPPCVTVCHHISTGLYHHRPQSSDLQSYSYGNQLPD